MSLRDITKDLHQEAETTAFAQLLLSGNITKEQYTNYLFQMIAIYKLIEHFSKRQGFFDTLPDIERLPGIYQDFLELEDPATTYHLVPSTAAYVSYLIDMDSTPTRKHLVKAHLYVRHMGDLFGGQIIKSCVPGQGRFYEFTDATALKAAIRAELTDDLGDEARIAFEWAIKIMRELTGE